MSMTAAERAELRRKQCHETALGIINDLDHHARMSGAEYGLPIYGTGHSARLLDIVLNYLAAHQASVAKQRDAALDRIDALEAENERLRAALGQVRGEFDRVIGSDDNDAARDIIDAALRGQTNG